MAIEVFRTKEFSAWMRRLADPVGKHRIQQRVNRLRGTGLFGDVKPVGEGVFEMRIDSGPGYRVYYAMRGKSVVLLLIGGGKATQKRDIARAKRVNEECGVVWRTKCR